MTSLRVALKLSMAESASSSSTGNKKPKKENAPVGIFDEMLELPGKILWTVVTPYWTD